MAQRDGELFDEPETFQYDRFMDKVDWARTVQTFNSCTSRPDLRQWMVNSAFKYLHFPVSSWYILCSAC